MARTYPVSLVLKDKRAVVVGGGPVAARKVQGLLECEALVDVVAPEATPDLQKLVDGERCTWRVRPYETSDLDEADIVFAATDDEGVNRRVYDDATAARLMVNVADRPEVCTFFLPSVLRRGKLSVSVSTEGASPLSARRIREGLEERFGEAYAPYLELMASWRPRVSDALPPERHFAFWEQASDGRVLAALEAGDAAGAAAILESLLK